MQAAGKQLVTIILLHGAPSIWQSTSYEISAQFLSRGSQSEEWGSHSSKGVEFWYHPRYDTFALLSHGQVYSSMTVWCATCHCAALSNGDSPELSSMGRHHLNL